jgi:hypothetical protein
MGTLETMEQRASAAGREKQTEREQVVEAMKEEIGLQRYPEAKRQLPILERAINEEFLPFTAHVRSLALTASTPLPTPVQQWLTSIENICATASQEVRAGIEGWERLSFAEVAGNDGRVDVMKRAAVVAGLRQLLCSHDGKVSFMRTQKTQAQEYIDAWLA